MSERLDKLKSWFVGTFLPKKVEDVETRQAAVELLQESGDNLCLRDLEDLSRISGAGEIPNEALTESGFGEISGVWRSRREPKRKPPTTGKVARTRRSTGRHKALNASSCDHRGVIKPRNKRKAS